jgi:hypothetical protein
VGVSRVSSRVGVSRVGVSRVGMRVGEWQKLEYGIRIERKGEYESEGKGAITL